MLHAGLADVAGGPVVRVSLQPPELVRIDPAHVSHHMGQRFAEGVLAHEPGVDVDPRQPVPVDREDGDLALVEPGLERNALERRKVAHLLPELVLFRVVDGQDPAQERERAVDADRLLRHDLQAEHREIAGEHGSVPIPHESAGGRNRTDPDPVLMGQRRVVLVLHDLEVPDPQEEGRGAPRRPGRRRR